MNLDDFFRAIVNPGDFDKKSTPHIDVRTGPGQHFVFTIECDGKVISTIVIIGARIIIIVVFNDVLGEPRHSGLLPSSEKMGHPLP